jgi:protein gp37
LLGPLGPLNLKDIEWIIAGGESGPKFRECKVEWVRDIRNQCVNARVPFFFKQWGGLTSKFGGRTLDGRICNEFPETKVLGLNPFIMSN